MSHFPVYQVLLLGPTKIEYLFLDESQEPVPTREPSPESLESIDTHLWDWIWRITTKSAIGGSDLVSEHLTQLHAHLLLPIGIESVPASIEEAIEVFVARRDPLEQQYAVSVDRALEQEVRRGIDRVLAR